MENILKVLTANNLPFLSLWLWLTLQISFHFHCPIHDFWNYSSRHEKRKNKLLKPGLPAFTSNLSVMYPICSGFSLSFSLSGLNQRQPVSSASLSLLRCFGRNYPRRSQCHWLQVRLKLAYLKDLLQFPDFAFYHPTLRLFRKNAASHHFSVCHSD